MTDETIETIDPRLVELAGYARAEALVSPGFIGWPAEQKRQLLRELTAALQRPSRDELGEQLDIFAACVRIRGVEAGKERKRAILDLACGPEPKPRGIPIHHLVLGKCIDSRCCDECPGVAQTLNPKDATSQIYVCTHPCHQEASDE